MTRQKRSFAARTRRRAERSHVYSDRPHLCIITLDMQRLARFSPLQTRLSWLPFAIGIVVGAGIAPKLLLRSGPATSPPSMQSCAIGVFWFSTIAVAGGSWTLKASAILLVALGVGLGTTSLMQAAVYGVAPDRAGMASALLNTAQ